MEVLYPTGSREDITLEQLLRVAQVRDFLQYFKRKENTNATSKIKYIRYFESFIKFIAIDYSSPEFTENQSNEEILTKDIKLKAVCHEIENVISTLAKNRGKDLITAKRKAKRRLINEEDTCAILEETQAYLREITSKTETELQKLNLQEIRKVRDSLIAVATIRLASRSIEIITMNLTEYANAEDFISEDNEHFKIIQMTDQKNARAGNPHLQPSVKTNMLH